MKSILTFCLLLSATLAFAADEHPCKAIKAACEKAGYVQGGHKTGKGLFVDCIHPVMEGKTVAGVTIAPGDVEACKAKKAEHDAKKK